MELLAAINAIEFASENNKGASLLVYTDSQYVFRIPERKEKLKNNLFVTKKGNQIQNSDLVQKLIGQIETQNVTFVKIKAHQQREAAKEDIHVHYNSEVDKLVRQIVREAVKHAPHPSQAEG